ncbi:MAG: alpha/beta hydrolase [Spirochaetaceae bacterium]
MECIIRDLKINYIVVGEGEPVVLIHGFSVDHRIMTGCMEPIFSELNNYKRIYIDLPGMGKSECNDMVNSSDDILEIVCEFIDAIIPNQQFLLVGQSYGGYISRGIINKTPEMVKGLLLICPVIYADRESRTLPEHIIVESDRDFTRTLVEDIKDKFYRDNVVLTKEVYLRYMAEIVTGINLADKGFLRRIFKNYSFSFNVDSDILFDKPTLIIVGKQDSVVGYSDAVNILKHYPKATYILVDGAGHNLQIEKPGFFNDITRSWLKNQFVMQNILPVSSLKLKD